MQFRNPPKPIPLHTCPTLPSDSHKTINQKSAKFLPFGRKRQIDDQCPEKNPQGIPVRKSREARIFKRQTSFDKNQLLKCESGDKNSSQNLSPHFTRTSKMTSPAPKHDQGSLLKFIRKPEPALETLRERYVSRSKEQIALNEKNLQKGIQQSLESVLTKGSDHSDLDAMPQNWLTLQSENEYLRRQKQRLESEITVLRELILKANLVVPKMSSSSALKRNNCLDMQNSIVGAQTKSRLQAKIRQLEKREEQLRRKLRQEQIQNDLLKQELLEVSTQLQHQHTAKIQLGKLVDSLRLECNQERTALEKNVVKQDMLLRQRAEFEGAKLLASKADKERQNFKKTIGEYKSKIMMLTQIIAKSRRQYRDQQIDLSLDLSTSIDSF